MLVNNMNNNAMEQISSRIYGNGRGHVFTSKDFSDLANHETIRQALSRLTREGKIRRLLRGVYEYPIFSTILDEWVPPDPERIASAIARAHGWTIVPAGETALNLLGLTTQVPARWLYHSDGPTKTFSWAGGVLAFRHRTNKEVTPLSAKTALLVQGLKALGKEGSDERVLDILREKLNHGERMKALKEARFVTAWVYEMIRKLNQGESPDA